MKTYKFATLTLILNMSMAHAYPVSDFLIACCPLSFAFAPCFTQEGFRLLGRAQTAERNLNESEITSSMEEGAHSTSEEYHEPLRTSQYILRKKAEGYTSLTIAALMGLSVGYTTCSFASQVYHTQHNE